MNRNTIHTKIPVFIARFGVIPITVVITGVITAVSASVTAVVDILMDHAFVPDVLLGIALPILLAPPVAFMMARFSELYTERVRSQEDLERNERIMKTAEQLAHFGILEWDIIANKQFWSDEIYRIIGHEPQSFEPTQNFFADAIHPEDKKRVLAAMNDAVGGGNPFDIECRALRPDGSFRTVHARGELILTDSGQPWRITGTLHDITERRQMEEELRQSEERYRNLVEGSIQGLFVHRDYQLLFANEALARLLGYPSVDAILALDNLSAWIAPDELERVKEHEQTHPVDRPGLEHFELKVKRADGSNVWVENISKHIMWEGAPATQVVYVDITEQKRSQELKDAFISIVSHELKTPITSLIGALSLLREAQVTDTGSEADELIGIATRNASRLHQLVDDILDIQQIDAGSFRLRPELTDIRYLLAQAVEINLTYADGCGVGLVMKSCYDGTVMVDPRRFLQVLTNLISNSAKYTHRGDTVTVQAIRNGNSVRFSVTDHGPGIPEDFRSRIFGRFARADTTASRAMGGTGLGLSIAKAFTEKMGGSIGFESEPDVATTFFIDLPIPRDDAPGQ